MNIIIECLPKDREKLERLPYLFMVAKQIVEDPDKASRIRAFLRENQGSRLGSQIAV